MWGFLNTENKLSRKNVNTIFKAVQRDSIERMLNPSLWTRIKFNFWKIYWRLYMPNYVSVKQTPFGALYTIESIYGGEFKIQFNTRPSIKEVKRVAKEHRTRKTINHANI